MNAFEVLDQVLREAVPAVELAAFGIAVMVVSLVAIVSLLRGRKP